MNISSFDTLFYTLAFLVPGFVIDSVFSMFQRRRPERPHLSFLRLLTLSAINYAIWSWLIFLLIQPEWPQAHPGRAALGWLIVILIGPLLLGFIISYFAQKDWARRFLQWIGLRPLHVVPTAWDWRFETLREPHWLLVTLQDGSQVAGYFGSQSFASSQADQLDLYVEQVWQVPNDGGPWAMVEPQRGILISSHQIRYVEFWPVL